MSVDSGNKNNSSPTVTAAIEAYQRGFYPIPIRAGEKRPSIGGWTRRPDDLTVADVTSRFRAADAEGATNIGLVLGSASGGLVDVDIDLPDILYTARNVLPKTPMVTGRAGKSRSHYWYRVTGDVPGTRRYKMPGGGVIVEFRSDHSQTLIPPSKHPSGEMYRWELEPWGGKEGPAEYSGNQIYVHVATLALLAILKENWPRKGSRHEAYLMLAGGLLRYGHKGVHPFWVNQLEGIIAALASITHDEEGESRSAEVMGTTIDRLHNGDKVVGWPSLAEIIGENHVRFARGPLDDIERIAGYQRSESDRVVETTDQEPSFDFTVPVEPNPLDLRKTSWDRVDLGPYVRGEIPVPEPDLLIRSDGKGLMYRGTVNMLFGTREGGKSLLAQYLCVQEIQANAGRPLYLDFEDAPTLTVQRLLEMGLGAEDIEREFAYIRPEDPIATLEQSRYGDSEPTVEGQKNANNLAEVIRQFNPTLIITDGMTDLYSIHGLNTNQVEGVAPVTRWLKRLCDNGRRTVVMIDHPPKDAKAGADPIGSMFKGAAVQGTSIQVDKIIQPIRGSVGQMQLIINKDRPARVRPHCLLHTKGYQIGGIVTVDSRIKDNIAISIEPADPEDLRIEFTNRQQEILLKSRVLPDEITTVLLNSDGPLWQSEIQTLVEDARNGVAVDPNYLEQQLTEMTESGEVYRDQSRPTGKAGRRPYVYRLPTD